VIAAAVLGGTSGVGGSCGRVMGPIVGAVMICLILMGLEFSQQLIAWGVIILFGLMIARSRR
jgi:predicted ABC-type sugar transport system permease subunit